MSKKNISTSRTIHKKTAMKNAAKFLALLIGFEVGLVMIFWLILILVTSTDLYYSDAFLPWKPLLQILMYVGFIILSILGCYYTTRSRVCVLLNIWTIVTEAAQLLATPTDAPVSLPSELKNIEDDLNTVRVQTLESQKTAREAEQRKDDLLVYLAHDLKTPLTSVLGYLKLLEDEPDISPELIQNYWHCTDKSRTSGRVDQ